MRTDVYLNEVVGGMNLQLLMLQLIDVKRPKNDSYKSGPSILAHFSTLLGPTVSKRDNGKVSRDIRSAFICVLYKPRYTFFENPLPRAKEKSVRLTFFRLVYCL